MRKKYRTDANHSEIVKAFEALDCSVVDLSAVASKSKRNIGVPDLLIGVGKRSELVEIKTTTGKESKSQIEFSEKWRGSVRYEVRSVADVVEVVMRIRAKIRGYV